MRPAGLATGVTLSVLLLLAGCEAPGNTTDSDGDGGTGIPTLTLNDTGVTFHLADVIFDGTSLTAVPPTMQTTSPSTLPGQDATYGLDAAPGVSDADGKGGFSFVKLDAGGNPLPAFPRRPVQRNSPHRNPHALSVTASQPWS